MLANSLQETQTFSFFLCVNGQSGCAREEEMNLVQSLGLRFSREQQQQSNVSSAPLFSAPHRRAGLPTIVAVLSCLWNAMPASAGPPKGNESYKILPAIVRGNLAIFPVVAGHTYDTSPLITLDEGIRSGQVTVTEAGNQTSLVHPGQDFPLRRGSAEVNRLVLYNNSSQPLLLLAGEIVTGGKQDRVIGADRIVPPRAGPIDLSVFCVEPGRWVESSTKFGSMGAQMAQPSVRTPAMAERDQNQVWDNVRNSNARVAGSLTGTEAGAVAGTSSYAKVFASPPVRKMIDGYGGVESEEAILRELRAGGRWVWWWP
jgi:hypothetical protein